MDSKEHVAIKCHKWLWLPQNGVPIDPHNFFFGHLEDLTPSKKGGSGKS
jgi:hypothetical protein